MIIRYEFTMTSHNDKLVIKEQLNLPSVFIKEGDVGCFQVEVVGVIDKSPLQLWHIIDDPAYHGRVIAFIVAPREPYGLVSQHILL